MDKSSELPSEIGEYLSEIDFMPNTDYEVNKPYYDWMTKKQVIRADIERFDDTVETAQNYVKHLI